MSCLDPGLAACLAIDRAAQGETKRRARAWVLGRKAGRRDVRSSWLSPGGLAQDW